MLVAAFHPSMSSVPSSAPSAETTIFESDPKCKRHRCAKWTSASCRMATAECALEPVENRLSTKVPKQQLRPGTLKAKGRQVARRFSATSSRGTRPATAADLDPVRTPHDLTGMVQFACPTATCMLGKQCSRRKVKQSLESTALFRSQRYKRRGRKLS